MPTQSKPPEPGDVIMGTGVAKMPKVEDIPHPVPENQYTPDALLNPIEGVIDRFDVANTRHMVFCERYATHGTGARAAREAGYSARGAGVIAHKLLHRAEIIATIDCLRREAIVRNEADIDYVVRGLMAESEYYGDGSSQAARIRALELLGKWRGMFKEQVEHSGKVGVVPSLEDVLEARQKMIQFRSQIGAEPSEPEKLSDK